MGAVDLYTLASLLPSSICSEPTFAPVKRTGQNTLTRALQAWLGHKNIQHTVRYTELAPDRFKNFWRD
jgi:hypothetical protein